MTLRQFFQGRNAPKQIDFARSIGCSPSYLGRLISGNRRAGEKYVPLITKHTGGRVTARDLNPDMVRRFKRLVGF